MSEIDVRLVRLEKLRVASLHGFGTEPELQAWEKLADFAGARGYLEDMEHHRIFGFNNPDPTPGSPNYGYELWITVDPGVQVEGEVEIKEFPGGLYAVGRCEATGDPYEVIPSVWQQLVMWREGKPVPGGQPAVAGGTPARAGQGTGGNRWRRLGAGSIPSASRAEIIVRSNPKNGAGGVGVSPVPFREYPRHLMMTGTCSGHAVHTARKEPRATWKKIRIAKLATEPPGKGRPGGIAIPAKVGSRVMKNRTTATILKVRNGCLAKRSSKQRCRHRSGKEYREESDRTIRKWRELRRKCMRKPMMKRARSVESKQPRSPSGDGQDGAAEPPCRL